MTKSECTKCKHNYKVLTAEKLCAHCYKEEHNEWAKEFSDRSQKGRGR